MNRQLPLTPAEAEKFKALAVGESMWIVREGRRETRVLTPDEYGERKHTHDLPPAGWLTDCAHPDHHGFARAGHPCPDCRIELVGPCPRCKGAGFLATDNGSFIQRSLCSCGGGRCTATLGYAYAIGQPLPIVGERNDGQRPRIEVTDHGLVLLFSQDHNSNLTHRLAHYGPPETLVGRWALQLAVTQ